MSVLFYLSLILLAGMLTAKVLRKCKFPNVTGYLIGGVIIGHTALNLVPMDVVESLNIVSDVALGFIAFLVGNQFKFHDLKRNGRSIVVITLFEALMAMGSVFLVMLYVFQTPLSFALLLGAIASATAPAATLMVIRQYNARGPLVNTLLPVVALDDVVSIITFGVAMSISKAIVSHATPSLKTMLLLPIIEIVASVAVGLTIGFIVLYLLRKTTSESNYLNILIAAIFMSIALSMYFHLSSLLSCMSFGLVLANFLPNPRKAVSILDHITAPIYLAFFTISGVSLELGALRTVGFIGIAYFLIRFLGKWLGAFVGCKITKRPDSVSKYLGVALMPQAGVALGLSLTAARVIGEPYGFQVRTVIVATTVVYELLGPMMSKLALKRAGEIQ